MIPSILDYAFNEKDFECLKDIKWGTSVDLDGCPANLDEIKRKKYNSFRELQAVVKLLLDTYAAKFPRKSKVATAAGKLIEFIEGEISSINTCSECYVNAINFPNDSFTMACDPPHVCVWAKYKDHCYWPSKVMSTTGETVHVRFFADHYSGKS